MARIYLEYLGNSIELLPGENILGRDMVCRIRFNDPGVSRRHLRIVVDYQNAIAEDLGSTNGSILNGERMTGPRMLTNGDELKLGSRTLKVNVLQAGAPPEAPLPDTLNEAIDGADDAIDSPPPVMVPEATKPVRAL